MILVALFFAAVFAVNGIPHFVQGVCGHRFQSPFASPPGVGESSPVVNVLWGAFNFLVAYCLLRWAGPFVIGLNLASLVFFGGGLAMALALSQHFGKVRNATGRSDN